MGTVFGAGCGYGFGNHEFRQERVAAIAFARALQARDTAQMRHLSWGRVQQGIPAIVRETPTAYVQLERATPRVVTLHGGGTYGGYAEFRVESPSLATCNGGVALMMMTQNDTSRVVAIHLEPPPDSVTDDACRARIGAGS